MYSCKCIKHYLRMCVAIRSYSLRRVRGTTIAAKLEFVHCLIYFKNDVQRTIASLLLNCYCKFLTPYVAAQSRESIQLAPANTSRSSAMPDTCTYAHIQITSVNRQLLTIIPHGLSNYFKLSSQLKR